MQLLPICNFFFGSQSDFCTENTTVICNRRIYATFFVVPEQLHISLFYCILLYMQLFPGSQFSEVLKASIFLRLYATRLYATFLWFPSSCIYPYSTVLPRV